MSRRSVASQSTVNTVDDVMSLLNSGVKRDASLSEARDYTRKIAKQNTMLADESVDELESIEGILSPITSNPAVLVNLMLECGAVLGGPQATSFFYPICEHFDCPWDFFCSAEKADKFIDIPPSPLPRCSFQDLLS